jgi:hypothetical protein
MNSDAQPIHEIGVVWAIRSANCLQITSQRTITAETHTGGKKQE